MTEKLETRFTALPKEVTSITTQRRFGNGLSDPPGGNRRTSFGEVRMEKRLPGESLRSSPGYMPRPLRGRVSRLPSPDISPSLLRKADSLRIKALREAL